MTNRKLWIGVCPGLDVLGKLVSSGGRDLTVEDAHASVLGGDAGILYFAHNGSHIGAFAGWKAMGFKS